LPFQKQTHFYFNGRRGDDMRELSRLIRRWVIRWQLRNLDREVATIVGARKPAKARVNAEKIAA
jgi:hypothetical protein